MAVKLTTLEMELALMKALNFRQNVIVPNVSWGISDGVNDLHECDLLVLSKSHYATEIEIKVSKSDLLRDKNKKHDHNHSYIKQLYFAVPEKLQDIALKNIPSRAGLYLVKQSIMPKQGTPDPLTSPAEYYYTVECVRKPHKNTHPHKWTNEEVMQVLRLGSMRIFTMKRNILKSRRPGLNTFFKDYVLEHITDHQIFERDQT